MQRSADRGCVAGCVDRRYNPRGMIDTREGIGMLRRLTEIGAALIVTAGSGAVAVAHPGHGTIPPEQPAHYLEPVHVLPVLLIISLGVAAFAWRRAQRK